MKKLSLLMFAILILACDTEKPVVEEPEVEEPPPVVMEPEPIGHPLIAKGSVTHGQVNVDPEPLNRYGFRFLLTESFLRYGVSFRKKDGPYLSWDFPFDLGQTAGKSLFIQRMGNYHFLESDTEYEMVISALNHDCELIDIVIQFRTKPQRPGVAGPALVIQERMPALALGERFRFEPGLPELAAAGVLDFHNLIDPEPLNVNGIRFEFNEPIRKYKIDLRLHKGATLGWLPRGLVEREHMDGHIQIMPAEGFPLLEFNTAYEVDIFVENWACWTNELNIVFHTKLKP